APPARRSWRGRSLSHSLAIRPRRRAQRSTPRTRRVKVTGASRGRGLRPKIVLRTDLAFGNGGGGAARARRAAHPRAKRVMAFTAPSLQCLVFAVCPEICDRRGVE